MSRSSSSNASSSDTRNINEDNRQVTESGGISLAKGAGIQINNEFSDSVAGAFSQLIDLAKGAGTLVADTTRANVQANERALNTVAQVRDDLNKGSDRIYSDLFPIITAGVLGVVAIMAFKKG